MRITANQVTFSRLILMPIVCVMMYGDSATRLWAVILGTAVGLTDLLDGWLARRQGPTILGGLMDPMADKVFIAIAYLPMADLGLAPWWLIALLFLREFVVTALRSSFEVRKRQLRTTYLAKLKTWIQMAGVGVFFLTLAVSSTTVIYAFLGTIFVGPIVAWVIWWLVTRRPWTDWKGPVVGAPWFGTALALYHFGGAHALLVGILILVVGITWASGLDYLWVGVRVLGRGELHAFDGVRLLGAIAIPLAALAAIVHTPAPAWAIIALVSFELAHGGLDNLVAHHGAAARAWVWGGRVITVAALLGAALLAPARATPLVVAALAASLAFTTAAFARKRRFYLEERLREQKDAVPPVASTAG